MISGKEPQYPPEKPPKYQTYMTEQMTQLLIHITENMEPVRQTSAAEGITEQSAYRYKKQWNEFGHFNQIEKR